MATSSSLETLPTEILIALPDYLHNIEDYINLCSTSRTLRECLSRATPNTILRLAASQTRVFFRPSPHYLVAATARELGEWARRSAVNEQELAERLSNGVDGLLDLALEHCGLTMQRIRKLHELRFRIVNPVVDIIDKCAGAQWYATENFWNGGVSDAYTVDADPPIAFFQLAIYGELFGPDFEAILDNDPTTRRLSVETRLEYIKYCVPGFSTLCGDFDDSRQTVQPTGPYTSEGSARRLTYDGSDHNIALTWVIRSSRWRPHWKAARQRVGPEFQEDFDDLWWMVTEEDEDYDGSPEHWRQRLWENIMICQGWEGMAMMRPGEDLRDRWLPRIRDWRERIAKLDVEPPMTLVGRQSTLEYPYLLGDLRICASGYVCGT